ncbi:hypothetical protein PBY51_002479 [Eleginops maclovinus]|uniref:Uncharacterized protein n=1 Tax=Eleginops maclovinus TaxID=56733 RepID=A0AAN7X634_ELEMC|nr:hypothetical protein PBY51_002479 [Eleginops maclovinus]
MLLRYRPANRVVPLSYRRYGTVQVVVPAAMFPVSPVSLGPAAAVRPSGPRPMSVSGGICVTTNRIPLLSLTLALFHRAGGCSTKRQAGDNEKNACPLRLSK